MGYNLHELSMKLLVSIPGIDGKQNSCCLFLLNTETRQLTKLRKDRLALSQTVAPSLADPV